MRVRHLTAELRGKDIELAKLLEDKMRIMSDLQVVLGNNGGPFRDNPPDYMAFTRPSENKSSCTKEELLSAVQETSRLASSIYSSGSNSNLARSVSSVGERQSAAYTSPILPKRAETFGGFDQQQQPPQPLTLAKSVSEQPLIDVSDVSSTNTVRSPGEYWKGLPTVPHLLHLEPEQQEAAVYMTHYLNTLTCMVSEHFTSLER